MGIIADALSIVLGSILGSIFKDRALFKNFSVFGISIMIISMVGFFENVFDVTDMRLESTNLMVVVFSLIVGSWIGDFARIDERLSRLSNSDSTSFNAFIDTTLFFGVGGLQISGPILLAAEGDNSQLVLKSIIDFPFALMFGVSYGKCAALSAIPVALTQLIIATLACVTGPFLNGSLTGQLCAMGYIVLFFTGFNLICESKNKINNTNMIPGIFMIVLFSLISDVWRLIK